MTLCLDETNDSQMNGQHLQNVPVAYKESEPEQPQHLGGQQLGGLVEHKATTPIWKGTATR